MTILLHNDNIAPLKTRYGRSAILSVLNPLVRIRAKRQGWCHAYVEAIRSPSTSMRNGPWKTRDLLPQQAP